ncbi:zinc finger protein ush-like isoform X1 [Saccostrea echinata]|uniref:zinc finger protein ush-like isoform X1 n=2 Tax=Saccostrea echinata TaxID=191078 RepID=UPI002A80E6FE|nr:zinc finger protein ush-like isoform X1 [Saccostrea echinata]
MSRRKQSNPKPIKRLSENEDSDSTMEKELSVDESGEDKINAHSNESKGISEDQQEPEEGSNSKESKEQNHNLQTNIVVKNEVSESEMILENGNTEYLKRVSVPNNILFVKKLDEEDANIAGRSCLLFSAIPLPSGSCIGPFKGEIVSLSSIKQGDLVLQAQEKEGEAGFVRVLCENGSWLSLLRPAPSESAKNASVYFEDGKIWCEIVSDLNPGTELLASFTINSNNEPESDVTTPETQTTEEGMETTHIQRVEVPLPKSSPVLDKPVPSHAALLYGCQFCGVRFSSLRTLQGHLTFYCSKKPQLPVHSEQLGEKDDTENDKPPIGLRSGKKRTLSERSQSPDAKLSTPSPSKSDVSSEADSIPAKVPKPEIFKCDMCSYSIDKLSSLNRHKRIHNRGDNSVMEPQPIAAKQDTYCKDCNIQFSSFSTFKCHKEVYCSKRLVGLGASSPSPGVLSPSSDPGRVMLSPSTLQQAMFSANSKASSGQARVILAPPILVSSKESADINYSYPTVIVQPVLPTLSQPKTITKELTEIRDSSSRSSPDMPLDLSTTKSDTPKTSISTVSTVKEEAEEEQTKELDLSVKVKEERLSPKSTASLSPPSRQMVTPKSSSSSPHSQRSEEHSISELPRLMASPVPPLITVPQLSFMGKPVPPVPHSVSKCTDCNIVFYKRENYMIHKKHYCSSRQNKSPSEDEDGSIDLLARRNTRVVATPESSEKSPQSNQETKEQSTFGQNGHSPLTEKSTTSRSRETEDIIYRFYCVPCKIKFSSASTLQAHKEFYCPHGKESEHTILGKNKIEGKTSPKSDEEIIKCSRCDTVFPSSRHLKLHFCAGVSGQMPIFRCIYCDFVTQTETRLSEHMKAHMPNKAYRCTLCGYRGNTVRGMRMHGKVHLDNGEDFTDDHMIEIEEPPLMPVKLREHMSSETGPIDVEAELIRLKNEPYKRRRSRKSYEKAEHASSIPRNISTMCMYCGQMFTDLSNFAMHLKLHEMIALQAAGVQNYKCQYCTSVCDTFESLMAHVYNKHPEKIPREQSSPGSNSRSSPGTTKSPEIERKSSSPQLGKTVIKTEPPSSVDEESQQTKDHELVSIKREAVDNTNEESGDTENIPKEVVTPSKRIKEEMESESSRSPLESSSENRDFPKSASCSPRSQKSPTIRDSLPKIKSENQESTEKKPALIVPRVDPHMMPYYHVVPAFHMLPSMVGPVTPQVTQSPKRADKYCRHCDITFTYKNSYLAHKKYYCSANMAEDITSPAQA